MTIQTLVAAVNKARNILPETMNLGTDSIVINQCDKNDYSEFAYKDCKIKWYDFAERGVGLSRNNALMRSDADIVLFADEDIVYEDDVNKKIADAFASHPDADMLLFNVDVTEERRTYYIGKESRVHLYNCGRYPAYSFACKRDVLHRLNITYNLLFGGGAKYANGEDSLFIWECIKKGMKVYAVPILIGREIPRPSTWFEGYNEKFFHDRGVLYKYLYGCMALPMGIRFLKKNQNTMCESISFHNALTLLKKGIREADV